MILLKIEQAKVAKQDPLGSKPNVLIAPLNQSNDNKGKDEDRATNKLDKTYLQLLDLYV